MALADLEERYPEEADSYRRDAEDAPAEEEECQEKEDDVVDGEDFAREREQPIDGIEDLSLAEQVAAAFAADGVLDFVDAGDGHAGEDDEDDYQEKQATNEL